MKNPPDAWQQEAKRRTSLQNRALHKWCELLAEALNDAGYDCLEFYKLTEGKLDISWNKELVKDRLWRPYQKAMAGCESTADAEKMDYPEIYREVSQRVAELTGVFVEWPCEDNLGG